MSHIFTVTLPDIGEGVIEGEVIEWRKKVGDNLTQDEPVVVVMTDKATVELPAPYPGKLFKQYYQAGEIAIKDLPLYDIELMENVDMPIEKKETKRPAPLSAQEAKQPVKMPASNAKTSIHQVHGHKGLATPPVRALAKQVGIDISKVLGTGREGRVTREDLINLAKHSKADEDELLHLSGDTTEPLIGIRNLMAKKMATSKAHIPHFSYFEQVEVERLIQLRHNIIKQAEKQGVHLTYMPFLIKALSMCIKKYPLLNSNYNDEANELIMHKPHNIGIAMTTRLGLIVPVLKNVQSMGIENLILAYDDLHLRAVQNKLLPAEMKEGTITISNIGLPSTSGAWATPVINYPEVAILAVSRIHPEPVVSSGAVVVKQLLNLSWSFDHRVIDGALAVQISHDFCAFIRDPAILL